MVLLYAPALALAFVITVVEMTEVVALVFALSAHAESVRHGALGAIAGTATVGVIALGFGALILAVPHDILLWASTVVLLAFGVFLFRSTIKSYRRARDAAAGAPPPPPRPALLFAGGFTVGATEALEAVIVLLALAAQGSGLSAIVGALLGGLILVAAAAVVHERIRKIKVPLLKLGATGLLFAFAVFWGGEAAGVNWPGSDLLLIPLFVLGVLVARGLIRVLVPRIVPVGAKG